MCRVWSRNLKSEEATARGGPQRHRGKKVPYLEGGGTRAHFYTLFIRDPCKQILEYDVCAVLKITPPFPHLATVRLRSRVNLETFLDTVFILSKTLGSAAREII